MLLIVPLLLQVVLTGATAFCDELETNWAKRQEHKQDLINSQKNLDSLTTQVRWAEDRLRIMREFMSSFNTEKTVATPHPVSMDEHTDMTSLIYDAVVEEQEASSGNPYSAKRVLAQRVAIATDMLGSRMALSMVDRMIQAEAMGHSQTVAELEQLTHYIQTFEKLLLDVDDGLQVDRDNCIALLIKEKEKQMGELKKVDMKIDLLLRKSRFVKAGIDAYAMDFKPIGHPNLFIVNPAYLLVPGTMREVLLALYRMPDLGLTVPIVKAELMQRIRAQFQNRVVNVDAMIHALFTDFTALEQELLDSLKSLKIPINHQIHRLKTRLNKISEIFTESIERSNQSSNQ